MTTEPNKAAGASDQDPQGRVPDSPFVTRNESEVGVPAAFNRDPHFVTAEFEVIGTRPLILHRMVKM